VILTENMFGDILSDESAMLTGSIGMLPSASVGAGGPGLFEPVHGSAPDIAGEGISNPVGAIASAALMLDHFGLHAEARRVEAAIETATASGVLTRDIGGTSKTDEVTDAIIAALTKALTPA
jgi:tartrate dehydrogenase/decarboxylase/D-malate dehydrogenase